LIVVDSPLPEDPPKMLLIERDHVVQALTTTPPALKNLGLAIHCMALATEENTLLA
jgi:hypothetical protein